MKKILSIVSAITILAFFILLIISTINTGGKQGRPGLNEVSGEVAVNYNNYVPIRGKDIYGKELPESSNDNDIIMIDFWASWCPPCIQEASVLSSSYEYWQSKNIRYIGIALWDNETSVKKFVEKYDFKYDITLDKDGKYAINYGVKALPEKFFINKDGEIVKKYIGPINRESLDNIIAEILEKE
ncbi:MAG: hypothetical protein CL762_01820 [Chloroflexi bacterium]|nr:hypothetical protein [Chloroflexota bacterium]